MFLYQLWQQSPRLVLDYIIAMLVAITLHELAHAVWAERLGDPTPRAFGRISLNPIRHLDPVGTLMFFLAGIIWATTPTNPANYRIGARKGSAQVALMGPLTNFVLAFLAAIPLRFGLLAGVDADLARYAAEILFIFVQLNLLLTVFNLLPIPPLDGFSVLLGILPEEQARSLAPVAQQGPMLLFFVFVLGSFSGFNFFGQVIDPPVHVLSQLVLGR